MANNNLKIASIPALIAAAAGLAGAGIGGLVTYGVADHQITANAEQSQSEFVRDKRISVYTSWLDNVNGLTIKEDAAWNALDEFLEDPEIIEAEAPATAIRDVRNHLSAMDSIEAQLSILASEEATEAAEDLMSAHHEVLETMEELHKDPNRAAILRTLNDGTMEKALATVLAELGDDLGEVSGKTSDSGSTDRAIPPGVEDALKSGEIQPAILRAAIKSAGESWARLYGSRERGLAEAQYADFITAARADLEVDDLRP